MEEKKEKQLRPEYRKNIKYSEFLLKREKDTSYEERMLCENLIVGIIPFRECEQADKYAYDITGKKNMSLVFARIPMNAKQIRGILKNILEILEKSKEYLLKEESFVLLPEFIFTNFPDCGVELCYYPEYAVPIKEQLERLLETLLNIVDYKEQEAVELVYTLYQKVKETDFQMGELLKFLEKKKNVCSEIEKKQETRQEHISFLQEEERKISPKRQSIFWNWLELIRNRKHEKNEYSLENTMVYEEAPDYATEQKTQFISVTKTELPNLYAEESGEHIFLEKVPFYIGSLTEYVDYAIHAEGVSRFHAKIECKDGQYYITDLNSTNGTIVNGCLLNAHEPEQLHTGDTIQFVHQNYIFLA